MKHLALLLVVACSTSKSPPPGAQGAQGEPAPSSSDGLGWKLDVTECERNQIFIKDANGPQSLTVVGKDGSDCVVHVKHSVGRDWTESDCKIPRDKGTIAITATDQIPGACSLVESGTARH